MCEIESIQPYHYQIIKGVDLKSPSRNYEDYLESSNITNIDKENAITQTCRLENYLNSIEKSNMSSNRLSSHLERSILGSAVKNIQQQYYLLASSSDRYKNKSTQTDYREIECQTIPWEPPYIIKPGHNPEVLTLSHLTWDHGLPAGIHEIELIKRMRIRREWDRVLPPMDTPANIRTRTQLLSALEADEWAFRDAEIEFVMKLRMDLAQKLLESRDSEKQRAIDERLQKLNDVLSSRKHKEIKAIKNKFSRELRKLSQRYRSAKITHRPVKRDIIKLHVERLSSFNIPKAPYECPKNDDSTKIDLLHDLIGSGDMQCRDWLLASKQRKQNRIATKSSSARRFCPRVHRRNEKRFEQITRDVESIEAETALINGPPCSLLKRKPKVPSLPSTPRRQLILSDSSEADEEHEDEEDEIERSASLLQKLVKGRAMQSELLEERNCYRELIEELQSAKALEMHAEETRRSRHQQSASDDLERLNEMRAREILQSIEGKTIAKTLTFLTDELERLEAEKRAHALAILAERELAKRQVEEATEEQLQLNRRDELDEMFRQTMKINQQSVETYLEDIAKDSIEWSSAKEAEDYIVDLADKTDEIAKNWRENAEAIDEEGLVSDMLYNLVLPEVEKQSARERLQERQRGYLCAAHASIYEATLNLDDTVVDNDIEVDSIESAVCMILECAEISDDHVRDEVHDILKEMFAIAENKVQKDISD